LQAHFGGELVWINPNQKAWLYLPRLLFGFHKLPALRAKENGSQVIHHFYNPDPFPFPYLGFLRKPVIYSVTCGVGEQKPNLDYLAKLAAVAVTDDRSFKQFKAWGLENVYQVRPGIDVSRFSYNPLPLRSEIRLMVGSAPWTTAQFRSKGVDALLEAAKRAPSLHLVFLWRGVLFDEMEKRIRQMGLTEQVTLLNKVVDVNQILAGVHASITLAESPGIIKAFPHSLLDSLAAGKPVLVSQAIPMADYVQSSDCGTVVAEVTADAILKAVGQLEGHYGILQKIAQQVGQRDFTQSMMLTSYQRLYDRILKAT
jgi:glycosyltransferase involved in cell wall biosynthesis